MKKIACVLITYRREIEIVERALLSIVNQTYKCVDVVLVNDYPEDIEHSYELQRLADRYDVKYVTYEHNSGACVARNVGANYTEGDYIAFLDDDDEWVLDKLEVQVKCAELNNADLVYGPFYLKKDGKSKMTKNNLVNGFVLDKVLAYNFIGGTSVPLIKKSKFDELNGFDEDLQSSQDYDLWIRIAESGKICSIDHPMIVRYFSNESVTTNLKKKKQGWERLNEKYALLFEKYPKSANIRYNNIANQSFTYGEYYYALKNLKKAIKYNWKSSRNLVEPIKGLIKRLLRRGVSW